MSASASIRGHEVAWDGKRWVHADDGSPAPGWGGDERPCPACGLVAEADGPDPCLGMLPDCESACCGHGVHEGWIFRRSAGVVLAVNVRPSGDPWGKGVPE